MTALRHKRSCMELRLVAFQDNGQRYRRNVRKRVLVDVILSRVLIRDALISYCDLEAGNDSMNNCF
jgi:hypothetical protein